MAYADRHELDFQQLQQAFADCIREPVGVPLPQGVAPERMAVYRELFFNNVEGFLADSFPVLRRLIPDAHWWAMARDFFARHVCRTPLFTQLGKEFLDYLREERDELEGDPPFLTELAHYEWVELALALSEADPLARESADDGLLHRLIRLSPLAWPLRYQYAVHRIGPESQDAVDKSGPVHLLVYRNREDEVVFLEIDPLTHSLLSVLQSVGEAEVSELLETLAEFAQGASTEDFIAQGLETVGQLLARGVLGTVSQPAQWGIEASGVSADG